MFSFFWVWRSTDPIKPILEIESRGMFFKALSPIRVGIVIRVSKKY